MKKKQIKVNKNTQNKKMDGLTQQKHAHPTPSSLPHFSQFKANISFYIMKGAWVSQKILTRCFFLHLFFHPENFSILLLPCPNFDIKIRFSSLKSYN